MAKKKPRGGHDEPQAKPQAAPTFRPLEGALKKLAEEKRAADKAKAAPAPPAKPPPPRPSTLSKEERKELDAMGRDDEFFFQRLMSGVVPLAPGKQRVTTAPEVKAKPRDLVTAASRA